MTDPSKQNDFGAIIRTRLVFEELVGSVFFGALFCGCVYFAASIVVAFTGDGIGFSIFLNLLFDSIYFSFLVFAVGFLCSVLVGIPLFNFLEKKKYRFAWPYFLAATAISLLFFWLATGKVFQLFDQSLLTHISILLPGPLISVLFARRMQPIWYDAERAERADDERPDNVLKLH